MRRSRLTLRHLPAGVPLSLATLIRPQVCVVQSYERTVTALVRPTASSWAVLEPNRASSTGNGMSLSSTLRFPVTHRFGRFPLASTWISDGRLGQGAIYHTTTIHTDRKSNGAMLPERSVLEAFDMAIRSNDSKAWENCVLSIRRHHGSEGAWELFELIQKNELLQVLSHHDTQLLRDEILGAALDLDSRLAVLVNRAHELLNATEFQWPDLYMKIVHHMLEHGQYERSVRWHLQLMPNFPPSKEVFGALLSSFVVDPSPQMQSNLTALYVSSTERQLYDHIIPVLFAAGLSKLARVWRKKLLAFCDYPMTDKCKPFLRFLATFYPNSNLSSQELEVGGVTSRIIGTVDSSPEETEPDSNKGQYSDAIVARWFASTWTSVEFAINLAQRLGLRIIGPRSLQSLALRESDSKTVALHISHIEKLGIAISPQTYCKALVFFAKHGEDTLLANLLACDVHPDEFDDMETRQMLMASSVREQDWKMETLLQGIEWAVESDPSTRRLHVLLDHELSKRKFDKAKQVLDRMEALKVNMSQPSALQLLEKTFRGLGKHLAGRKRRAGDSRNDFEALLTRAIDVTRRVALHDVAIPLQFWRLLLYNLGRSGRFSELEQLCVEIVQLYTPPLGGLIPVHPVDLPNFETNAGRHQSIPLGDVEREDGYPLLEKCHLFNGDMGSLNNPPTDQSDGQSALQYAMPYAHQQDYSGENQPSLHQRSTTDSDPKVERAEEDGRIEGTRCFSSTGADLKQYIPADLSFGHRQHPVQKIFNAHLQRSIIRWGFDQMLQTPPTAESLVQLPSRDVSRFDVARGVRLLAMLREQGVLIDVQIVRTTILARLALAQVPGRKRDRSRDRHELSIEHMKCLFDEAWGSELLPSAPEMARQLEHQKPRLWSRYSKLFGRSFDTRQKVAT